MTALGILHIAVFMTLCEANMGIAAHFNLWNYFFRVWLQSGSDAEAAVWGRTDISVRSGPGVDPYFRLLMSNPLVRWQKQSFFLRNDVGAPVPVFTGKHPIPQPNWGYGVVSHPVFMPKLNAFLYVCQDQVSHTKRQIVE
jgi:hypothetical protein